MTDRIIAKLEGYVQDALSKGNPPTGLEWDLGIIVIPNQQGQIQPGVVLLMSIPSPILGERIPAAGIMLNPHTLTEATIQQVVANCFTSLHQARSDALAQSMPETNGHTPEMVGKGLNWPPQG